MPCLLFAGLKKAAVASGQLTSDIEIEKETSATAKLLHW